MELQGLFSESLGQIAEMLTDGFHLMHHEVSVTKSESSRHLETNRMAQTQAACLPATVLAVSESFISLQ